MPPSSYIPKRIYDPRLHSQKGACCCVHMSVLRCLDAVLVAPGLHQSQGNISCPRTAVLRHCANLCALPDEEICTSHQFCCNSGSVLVNKYTCCQVCDVPFCWDLPIYIVEIWYETAYRQSFVPIRTFQRQCICMLTCSMRLVHILVESTMLDAQQSLARGSEDV